MRKALLILLAIFIAQLSYAQNNDDTYGKSPKKQQLAKLPISQETGLVTYSEIIDVPKVSKDELFLKANSWFLSTFKSAKQVIEFSDKESGKIVGKGSIPVISKSVGITFNMGSMSGTFTIRCKDEKFMYTFAEFYHEKPPYEKNIVSVGPIELDSPESIFLAPNKKQWEILKDDFNTKVLLMIYDLKKKMAQADKDF